VASWDVEHEHGWTMRTYTEHDLEELAAELRRGRVAAIPTDTVYGLAAVPSQPAAIEAIYVLKGRPAELPLPILAADLDAVLALLGQLPPAAVVLARACWPGALTLVVPAPAPLAAAVGSTDATVGVRVPDHALVRRLLARSGTLAVTSANRHGEPPCLSATQVRATFVEGPEPVGVLAEPDSAPEASSAVPSTVVAVRPEGLEVLREGTLRAAALRRLLDDAGSAEPGGGASPPEAPR
jgi:L-threonylcarbamoyladenylate synthase